jgi:hypothetical protein
MGGKDTTTKVEIPPPTEQEIALQESFKAALDASMMAQGFYKVNNKTNYGMWGNYSGGPGSGSGGGMNGQIGNAGNRPRIDIGSISSRLGRKS